jgi:hypothetical protein
MLKAVQSVVVLNRTDIRTFIQTVVGYSISLQVAFSKLIHKLRFLQQLLRLVVRTDINF